MPPDYHNEKRQFSAVVEAHYKPLYRFAFSLAKSQHEACDLTQETFAIYARKVGSIKDVTKTKSWLFTTLYREFLRTRRRDKNTTPTEHEILEAQAPSVDPGLTNRIDSQTALDALNELEESFRIPLTLFYLEHLSYKEISETLDIPIGTVMSRLSRAKAQLKQILGNSKVEN